MSVRAGEGWAMRSRASALITEVLLAALALSACGKFSPANAVGGDTSRGAAAMFRYGCGTCHTIQSLPNAHGLVGPPLTGLRDRMYVAGMLQNTPENLRRWIR